MDLSPDVTSNGTYTVQLNLSNEQLLSLSLGLGGESDPAEGKHMDFDPDATGYDTYTIQLKLDPEQLRTRGFLYELVSRLEGWAGVEVLNVQLRGQCEKA
ncbi:hypothetical protein HX870_26565 [Pseudomonas gingeri]|uniref:hypothetical protein n=1 Tax=Pseudomonas gingeri TaxID=117681 RepID=UPI0015A446AB|nr:hypothetical protein [Pseudomonas gingeri]NWD71166.1 hypothetical protein [Pseudomonas gingeri]